MQTIIATKPRNQQSDTENMQRKSFKTIMLSSNQACTEAMKTQKKQQIRASVGLKDERETVCRPLLEHSPQYRPFRLHPPAHTHTYTHSKQQKSRRCFLVPRSNQLSPPSVCVSPSEVSGCLCTLRFKGKVLVFVLCKVA